MQYSGYLAWFIVVVCSLPSMAQVPESRAHRTAEDYQNMLGQIGVREVRSGPSGDPAAPNAANSDEHQVKLASPLPDPLVTPGGKTIRTRSDWFNIQRPRLVELTQRWMYGAIPEQVPSVSWQASPGSAEDYNGIRVRETDLLGIADNHAYPELSVAIHTELMVPENLVLKGVMIRLVYDFPPEIRARFVDPTLPDGDALLLAAGWAVARIHPYRYQPDDGAGLTEGIIGLTNRGHYRTPAQWGALRAWAWGVSRLVDYIKSQPDLADSPLGIEGMSRFGKAALVAMAYDSRIDIGLVASAGAGGTSLLRRNFGEQVENLTSSSEYHWFAGNFIHFASDKTLADLPFDAHTMIALCAPRPLFISTGNPAVEGHWVDARGMYQSANLATPVYQLLGKSGVQSPEMPAVGDTDLATDLVFRAHQAGHTTAPNWPYFIQFAQRVLSQPVAPDTGIP